MVDNNKVTLVAVGDIGFRIEENNDTFDGIRTFLKKADIALGQLEQLLSGRGPEQVHFAGFEVSDMNPAVKWRPNPEAAVKVLVDNGFNIINFASNHALDKGYQDMYDTMDILRKNNIAVHGAGRNLEDARRPVILERKGTKVGFLAYCSIFRMGYFATKERGGVTPMRFHTAYEVLETQVNVRYRPFSWADPRDLADMVEDIKKLRPQVDVLVASMHWGQGGASTPGFIGDYQFEVGHAAIDAGADIVIGQHQHILKGIEVYKGKVIFHGIGQISMRRHKDFNYKPVLASGLYWIDRWGVRTETDPDCPRYPYDIDARKTIMVKCDIVNKKIERVAYVPLWLNKEAVAEPVLRSDPRSDEHLHYIRWASGSQRIDTKFSREGDEVVILT